MTEIYIKVEPGSDDFRIEFNDFPTFYLESEAEQGRANGELVKRLEDILDEAAAIVSGHHSRRKKIKVGLEKDDLEGRLRENG